MVLPLGKKKQAIDSSLHVRYKGLFDFEGLYRFMYGWLERRHYQLHEKKYKDKIDTALGNEIEIKWDGKRKITEFIQYFINIYIHLWTAKEVEVTEGGNKKKMMKARMDIKFDAYVMIDYTGILNEKKGLGTKIMGKIFMNLKDKDLRLKYIKGLEDELFKLQGDVKKFLNIEAKEGAYG